jgi:hypothetical protein
LKFIDWLNSLRRRLHFAWCLWQAQRIVDRARAAAPLGFDPVGLVTNISDVIVPTEFLPYVVERTAALSVFFTSGIIDTDPAFATLAAGGGQTVVMPFWQDLQGADQVLTDQSSLSTKKIGAVQDTAVLHNRGDAWSVNDLAKYLSGDDPMGTIAELVGAYWARRHEDQLIAQVNGALAAANMTGNYSDISTGAAVTIDNTLSGVTYINMKQLLGDAKSKLVAIAMHSAVEASLLKQDLIDFVPVTDARERIEVFQGAEVIIDDNMTSTLNGSNVTYTSVLFGRGAFAMGVSETNDVPEGAAPNSTWQLEFGRVILANQSVMVNRRRFLLHLRGVKWNGASMAGPSPTNAELATASNWTRVYEQKNVRLVALRHNVIL